MRNVCYYYCGINHLIILTSEQYYWNHNWLGLCITTYSFHVRITRVR